MTGNFILKNEEILGHRSKLLIAFFEKLNLEGINYAVMNNYEDLPHIIPSDVDITVPATFFSRLDRFILDFTKSTDSLLIQKLWHGNQKCAYIVSAGPVGMREYLQLDFFVAFSTKGCPCLISHEALIAGGRDLRFFHVPAPQVELLFTAMRRLFKDDWSERHCARISELYHRIKDGAWLPPSYSWLRGTIDRAIQGDVAGVRSRRAADWARLRKTARGNLGLAGQLANAIRQAWRIALRLRDETGLLVVGSGRNQHLDLQGTGLLESVFHRQLRLDENFLMSLGTLNRMLLPARLALLKRRKGLAFLHVETAQPLSQSLAYQLSKLGFVDLHITDRVSVETMTLRAPIIRPKTEAEAIEAIIRRQAEKTAHAIALGGTQTSK